MMFTTHRKIFMMSIAVVMALVNFSGSIFSDITSDLHFIADIKIKK